MGQNQDTQSGCKYRRNCSYLTNPKVNQEDRAEQYYEVCTTACSERCSLKQKLSGEED